MHIIVLYADIIYFDITKLCFMLSSLNKGANAKFKKKFPSTCPELEQTLLVHKEFGLI